MKTIYYYIKYNVYNNDVDDYADKMIMLIK